MVDLKLLEQQQRRLGNNIIDSEPDLAGAYFVYADDLRGLQDHIRNTRWVGKYGIPEVFPGTRASYVHNPSDYDEPKSAGTATQFRRLGRSVIGACDIADRIETLERQFQNRAGELSYLPPREPIQPHLAIKSLSKIILAVRHSRGISQVEVANRALVNWYTVSRIEAARMDISIRLLGLIFRRGLSIAPFGGESMQLGSMLLGRSPLITKSDVIEGGAKHHLETVKSASTAKPYSSVGLYLRKIRQARGLSLNTVAKHSGLPSHNQGTFSVYELGRYPQFTYFLGWLNGLRVSEREAMIAWSLLLHDSSPA